MNLDKTMKNTLLCCLMALLLTGCALNIPSKIEYDYTGLTRIEKLVHRRTQHFITQIQANSKPFPLHEKTRIDSLSVDRKHRSIRLYLSRHFSYYPFREDDPEPVYRLLRHNLGYRFRKYDITIYTLGTPLHQLVPNFFREELPVDQKRLPRQTSGPAIVTKLHRAIPPVDGLANSTIALWPSHGWYFDNSIQRWDWQRPRLFGTVEDILPLNFTTRYLIPMLENAGANVFTPRERDIQIHEIIVDNDDSVKTAYRQEAPAGIIMESADSTGWGRGNPPYASGESPFGSGTYRYFTNDSINNVRISWVPEIPSTGWYSVQIAYQSLPQSAEQVIYTVTHTGGATDFAIDQRFGGGTWIYLGKFHFEQGRNPAKGRVTVVGSESSSGKIITADAVRFGGGMGNVARDGQISRRPRYQEAARYYLQYAGLHDTLVYNLNCDTLDYNDDYQSRGEWVNYLRGAPFGPNRNRQAEGLSIPVDLSLAFHTDAGTKPIGNTVGTLAIYSVEDIDSLTVFPDGQSRLVNRDLADIVQTEIVNDIRSKYDPGWQRRQLMNAAYSEAYRPNVPSMLLELLSHQNFTDMEYGNDPRFRFDVSRGIYKGIVKFLATQQQREYVIQPLPVSHLHAHLAGDSALTLAWRPVVDDLEVSADPTGYIVYTRSGQGGFDNGTYTPVNELTIKNIETGVVHSYRVTAVNSGGESFPSEIISVGIAGDQQSEPVLIINGFNRVAGPDAGQHGGWYGYLPGGDEGVADGYNFARVGHQIDFDPASPFQTNTFAGFGSSSSENEVFIIPGNTRDFAAVHGAALLTNGRSFNSASDEAVMDSLVDLRDHKVIDMLYGEEKRSRLLRSHPAVDPDEFAIFPTALRMQLNEFLAGGGSLFTSGAHVASDIFGRPSRSAEAIAFVEDTLKYSLHKDRAEQTGIVFSCDTSFAPFRFDFRYNTSHQAHIYTVESPDAIFPVKDQSKAVLRYGENHYCAAVGYKGEYSSLTLGFPFETLLDPAARNRLMGYILNYLEADFTTITTEATATEKNQAAD